MSSNTAPVVDTALPTGVVFQEASHPALTMCDRSERKYDSEPAIFPSLFFTEEEANSVDWEAVFAEW